MFRSTTPSWSALRGVVLRQSAQQLNDHRLKPAIFLGCSDLGTLALWHLGTLALWHFGTLALWHFSHEGWLFKRMDGMESGRSPQ